MGVRLICGVLVLLVVVVLGVVGVAQSTSWILVEPGVAFESLECDFKLCYVQFNMPIYASEIWVYKDHIWLFDFYVPIYLPKPISFGIGVWNGNATVTLVTHNMIRVVVYAPTNTKSTLILYGVKPYRLKLNGHDITDRALPDLKSLNTTGMGWLHTGQVLYLRATHNSPVVWDIYLSESPQSEPTDTQTPIVVLPYIEELNTTTTTETITMSQEQQQQLLQILAIVAVVVIIASALLVIRRRSI